MPTKIIGLGHKARHGKGYAARAIIAHCATNGLYAREYGFSDALKAYARVLGMRTKDPRLLQVLGTEVFRTIDPHIWVRILLDTIAEQAPDLALITDLRFPNEADAIREAGGKLIRVTRLNADGSLWVAPDRDPSHPSETALDHYTFDAHIAIESGNITALRAAAVIAYQELEG